jgi:hypothetical protein
MHAKLMMKKALCEMGKVSMCIVTSMEKMKMVAMIRLLCVGVEPGEGSSWS